MNSCCVVGGGCCSPITVDNNNNNNAVNVQVTLSVSVNGGGGRERREGGECCCTTNGLPMDGCCQVILLSYSGTTTNPIVNVSSTTYAPQYAPLFITSATQFGEKLLEETKVQEEERKQTKMKEEDNNNNNNRCGGGCCTKQGDDECADERDDECDDDCCAKEEEGKDDCCAKKGEEKDDCCAKKEEESEDDCCEDECCGATKKEKEEKVIEKKCEDEGKCCGEKAGCPERVVEIAKEKEQKEVEVCCSTVKCCESNVGKETGPSTGGPNFSLSFGPNAYGPNFGVAGPKLGSCGCCSKGTCSKGSENAKGNKTGCCAKTVENEKAKKGETGTEKGGACTEGCCSTQEKGKPKSETTEKEEEDKCSEGCCEGEEETPREVKSEKGCDCCAEEGGGGGGESDKCSEGCCGEEEEEGGGGGEGDKALLLKKETQREEIKKSEKGCCAEEEVGESDKCSEGCCGEEEEEGGDGEGDKAFLLKKKEGEQEDKCSDGCCDEEEEEEEEGGDKVLLIAKDVKKKEEEDKHKKKVEDDNCSEGCCDEEFEGDQVSLLKKEKKEKKEKKGKGKQKDKDSCNKGCCEKEEKKEQKVIVIERSGCSKGCCEKEEKKEEKSKEKEKDKCTKGCCEKEEKKEKKKEKEKEKEKGDCTKGCCEKEEKKEEKEEKKEDSCCAKGSCADDEQQAHSISICCSVCWGGLACCQRGCCGIACCLTVTAQSVQESKSPWWPFSFSFNSSWKKLTNDDKGAYELNLATDSSSLSVLPSASSGNDSLFVEIGGMTCTDCATSIQTCLTKLPGVLLSDITYVTGKGRVAYDMALVTENQIIKQIEKLGFSAEPISQNSSKETKFGISLPDDTIHPLFADDLVNSIRKMKGVTSVNVDVRARTLGVVHDFDQVSPHALAKRIREAGWIPRIPNSNKSKTNGNEQLLWGWKWRFWAGTLLTIPVIICAYVLPSISGAKEFITQDVVPGLRLGDLIAWICATPIQFVISAKLYASAAKSLAYARKANVDTLVMLSSSAAYAYSLVSVFVSLAMKKREGESFFETCAILLTLIMLGRYIETFAKEKTRKFLTGLVDVPQKCTVVNGDGTTEEEEVEWIGVGDTILVVPGEKIASDGIVVFGSSEVDESMLTGESIPVPKHVDDAVSSGSINCHGAIHVKITKRAGDSTFAKIRKLVEDAQASRANLQRTTDKLASYFVPVILVVALIVFAVWLGVSTSLPVALRYAVSVLVVACPCALALAVPSAVMVGMEVGARLGILYKSGGPALENLHSAQVVVFDKTGTLTRGAPAVVAHHLALPAPPCMQLGGEQCRKMGQAAARGCGICASHHFFAAVGCAEGSSEHPVGRAIASYARVAYPSAALQMSNFASFPGKGITCEVGDIHVCVGNELWMRENGIEISEQAQAKLQESEAKGETVVCVGFNRSFAGSISLLDVPKPEAREVVQELQKQGVEVWMMSGDSEVTVISVGQQLGIHNVHGGLLPADKLGMITDLQAQGKKVVMVGDGINDSPSLAQADVGIAIGTGTDIAIEAADVVLMKEHLHNVIVALDLSRKTFARIRGNLAWSVIYNILALVLASGMLYRLNSTLALPPSVAGASELVSSVPVLIASFMLNYYAPPRAFGAN